MNKIKNDNKVNLSLCISRVMNNVTKENIYNVLDDIRLGEISHIDIINKNNNGDIYKIAFIHFKEWFDTENSNKAIERLTCGKDIKIIYDFPWFWKITPNRSKSNSKSIPKSNPKSNSKSNSKSIYNY
jgi:hypothetical protein